MIRSTGVRRLAVLAALVAVIGAFASPALAGRGRGGGSDGNSQGGGASIQSFKGS
jgi:hypothetical protein